MLALADMTRNCGHYLLVLAWLHPALRGAVSQLYGMVGAMLLAGPLTAVFVSLFAEAVLGDNVLQSLAGSFALSWAGVFVVGLLPQVISFMAVTGAERMVAARLETKALQGTPQVGKAIATAGARGLATGATIAGRAGYAQTIRVKPLADRMRAVGVMVGKAREAVSSAIAGLQAGLEGRVSKASAAVGAVEKRLEGLKRLRGGLERYHELKEGAYQAKLRWGESLEYYRQLTPEEQENPENAVGLALALMEHQALEEARDEVGERVREQLKTLREANVISSEDYRMLKSALHAPALAVQAVNKMIEEQEYQLRARKAELGVTMAIHKPMAKLVEQLRVVPTRIRRIISDLLTQPRRAREEELG
jgi:hypothetical protein